MARRQPWADQDVQLLYALSDHVRLTRRRIDALRRSTDWDDLSDAAQLDTLTNTLEAELDEVMMLGRA